MRNIDKFILYVVHNWKNELNEAYAPSIVSKLMTKFKEEADDLNINISDEQLKSYINRFDQIRSSSKVTEKDLFKYSLSQLVKLVTSSKGVNEPEDEIDITPDVVYNENGLIIYNGSKESNCLTYGSGERWCITRGSFGNYRYDDNRKNPTFYLVKDTNLPDSDRKSFFVVVVGKDNTYKVSDRSNNDVGGRGTEWDRWESWGFVERNFPSIRGLQRIFKYIPLSSSEKINQSYKNNPATYREWTSLPYSTKEQYLVVRKGKNLFSDIDNSTFVEKYLNKYPQIANFIATNAGIVNSITLVKNLEKFSNQDTRSIIANMRDKIDSKFLSSDDIPFEVKKLLVKVDKWNILPTERLYVTKDGSTIVKLKLDDELSISLFQAEDDYPNIKINKRTSKYLIDYPELDKIPIKNLLKLASDEVIDKSLINKIIDNAESEGSNSALIIKSLEDGSKILFDSNSLTSYIIDPEGKIKQTRFVDVQQQLSNEIVNNESFIQNIISTFSNDIRNINANISGEGLKDLVKSLPFGKRRFTYSGRPVILLTTGDEDSGNKDYFFVMNDGEVNSIEDITMAKKSSSNEDWRNLIYNKYLTENQIKAYFTYLRQTNKSFNDDIIQMLLRSSGYYASDTKRFFIKNNPPMREDSTLIPAFDGENYYIVNKTNPGNSYILSPRTGKFIRKVITPSLLRTLGISSPQAQTTAQPQPGAPRRGRPAGSTNRQPAATQPTPAGGNTSVVQVITQIGLNRAWPNLPRAVQRRLSGDAISINPNGDRGAARRNNQLGTRGRVEQVLQVGASKVYIIRLANNQRVASINIQPGNYNYLLTSDVAQGLNSPTELLAALQRRNLAETHRYIVNEYFYDYPHHLFEFKKLLRKHLEEKKSTHK